MIELKLQLWGAKQLRITSEYLADLAAIEEYDVQVKMDAGSKAYGWTSGEVPDGDAVAANVKRVVEEAQAEEPAPKKRGRPKKEETPADAKTVEPDRDNTPAPNITASPEDRQPVEDAVIVEEMTVFEMTEQDVRDALGKLVAKKGMADAMTWVKATTGFSKMSEIVAGVAEGKTTFREFVLLVEAEIGQ